MYKPIILASDKAENASNALASGLASFYRTTKNRYLSPKYHLKKAFPTYPT